MKALDERTAFRLQSHGAQRQLVRRGGMARPRHAVFQFEARPGEGTVSETAGVTTPFNRLHVVACAFICKEALALIDLRL